MLPGLVVVENPTVQTERLSERLEGAVLLWCLFLVFGLKAQVPADMRHVLTQVYGGTVAF